MSDQKINIGLASFGLSSQVFHAPFISRNVDFDLKYIVERNKNDSKTLYPKAQILKSFQELLQKEDVVIVVINTPTYLHFSMAKEALEAGKHVVLEKPMATNLAQAKELASLAQNKNLILAVFQNRRLESGFKTLKNVVDSGQLGSLNYFKSHFNRYKPNIGLKKWKEESSFEGAGIFYDLSPHLIDQALTLFGEPKRVNANFKKERVNSAVVDYFFIEMLYETGLKVVLEAGMTKQTNEPKYVLEGSKGAYAKQKEDPQEDLLRDNNYPELIDPDNGKITFEDGTEKEIPNIEGTYADFYDNLALQIKFGKEPLIKVEEALNVMRIMDLCLINQT